MMFGAVPRNGCRRNRFHRAEVGARVEFGDPDDQAGHDQADDSADVERLAGERSAGQRAHADQVVSDEPDGNKGEDRRGDKALVERAHDRLASAEPHEERADDRRDDAGAADGERIGHHGHQ